MRACVRVCVCVYVSRNAFTVISNLAVYGVAWLLFARDQLHKDDGSVNPDDAMKFTVSILMFPIGLNHLNKKRIVLYTH